MSSPTFGEGIPVYSDRELKLKLMQQFTLLIIHGKCECGINVLLTADLVKDYVPDCFRVGLYIDLTWENGFLDSLCGDLK